MAISSRARSLFAVLATAFTVLWLVDGWLTRNRPAAGRPAHASSKSDVASRPKAVTITVTVTKEVKTTACVQPLPQILPSGEELPLRKTSDLSSVSVRIPHPLKIDVGVPSAPNSLERNSRRYSRLRCLGDDNRVDGYVQRACVFENVCYNVPGREWRFYTRPQTPIRPVLFDKTLGEITSFTHESHGFVALKQTTDFFGADESNTFGPTILHALSPAAASPDTTVVLKRRHALWSSWAPDDNLGHVLWEEMANLYYSMIRLDVYDPDIIPIHFPSPVPDRPLFAKFLEAFFGAISHHKPIGWDSYVAELITNGDVSAIIDRRQTSPKVVSTASVEDLAEAVYFEESTPNVTDICFDELLAGGNIRRFLQRTQWHNHGHEPMFRSLRAKILSRHQLQPNYIPSEHKIVITNKTASNFKDSNSLRHHRDIYNLVEVVDDVKKRYPKVKVEVVEWHKLSIKDQLKLMLETTLIITPAGGVSMLLPFLPEGSHAIIMDYLESERNIFTATFGTTPGDSVSMEAPFWNHWPHFRKHYYQIRGKEDLRPDDPSADIDEVSWRDEASVMIDLERLDGLLQAAFEDMAP